MPSPTTTGLHCLFLLVSACCQIPRGSNFYPISYVIDSTLGHESFYPEMQRQKRNMLILDLSLPEYTVDIEVTLQDSSYLEPIKDYFKNIHLPINISNAQTTVSNISITTVCLPSGENSSCCFCENGYAWPSTVCSDVMPCPSLSLEPALPCGYVQEMPFYGPYCEPQTEESCGMGEPIVMNMSVRLDSGFRDDLKDSSSVLYQKYKMDLEKAFNASYRCLPGFVSATVTGFSPGSVFVNYEVRTGAASFTQVGNSNRAVPQFLDSSYQLNKFTFTRVITNETNFTVKPSNIFEGDTVRLTCEINSTFTNATWYHFDQTISTSSRYSIEIATRRSTLKITNVTMKDSGSYSCVLVMSSLYHTEIHNATETISVFPLQVTPNFEDTDVTCNSPEVQAKGFLLSCCIDRHLTSLKVSWKVNGTINITGTSILSGNCTGYLLNINESLCPPEKSGAVTTYTCELETGHGARRARSIRVTYLRKAHVTISSTTNSTVSEGYGFNVTCESDVNNYDSISWKIQSGNCTKTLDCAKCINNEFPGTSVLTVKSASQDWRGTYICTFSQKNLDSSANVTIEVISLPLKKNILIDPIATSIECQVPHALECCIDAKTVRDYRVTFFVEQNEFQVEKKKKDNLLCYMYNHTEKECKKEKFVAYCRFINRIGQGVNSENITLHLIPGKKISCSDKLGIGTEGAILMKPCCDVKNPKGFTRGNITYHCRNSLWIVARNDCLSGPINDLLSGAESLVNSPEAKKQLPSYLAQLKEQTEKELTKIHNSSANIGAIVTILDMVSFIPVEAEEVIMQNFLSTVDSIVDDSTTEAWEDLNKEKTRQSSLLLKSVENFSLGLQPVNNTIPSVSANTVQLQGIVVKENNNTDYNKDFHYNSKKNLTVNVLISETEIQTLTQNSTIVSVMYSKLGHILPRNTFEYVNGLLITTTLSSNRSQKFDVNMTFAKNDSSLKMPKCVFWNFALNNDRGDWDTRGCTPTELGDYVTCSCNHLTSFSILMSPDRSSEIMAEDYISYIGLAISIMSLVVCIIIESLVWKYVTNNTTSYMRHVCILNIAISLLIADVWFIVTASITDQNQQMSRDICIVATFFIHFFYLCVFFWMLSLGLILFYRLVFILHNTSKTTQKAVAFCLGYVCPFVIAVTTIAVTLPKNGYTRKDVCWLNWNDSKALLAFVIPALIIVATNLFIAAVVIIKILRPTIGDRSSGQERKSLFQIGKSVAILTPLLGLTWGLGLAIIIEKSNQAFHILFSLLNALQGLFILVFGTLWDKKIQEALLKRNSSSKWSSQQSKGLFRRACTGIAKELGSRLKSKNN